MTAKTKRRMGLGLSLLIIAGTIALTAIFMGFKSAPERKNVTDTRVSITTTEIVNKPVDITISAMGKTEAKEKIEIYAEVSGVLEVTDKDFLEGVTYTKNEVMLKINSDESYMSLISQRSTLFNLITRILPDLKFDYPDAYENWKKYLEEFEIEAYTKSLPEPTSQQERYYVAGQNIYTTYYSIKSLETRLAKYEIRAPYSGVVSESYIKPGTLVRSGQKVGSYFNPEAYYVEVDIKPADAEFIKNGDKVIFRSAGPGKEWTGSVSRIGKVVDNQTQTVKVYLTVKGSGLREGMFLTGKIITEKRQNAFEIPRSLIVDNNKVLVLQGQKIYKKEINIIHKNDDVVVAEGLQDGTLISNKTKGISEGTEVKL